MPVPPPGLTSLRTTEGAAIAESASVAFDLSRASVVRLAKELPNAHATRRVSYEVTSTVGPIAGLFPSSRHSVSTKMRTDPPAVRTYSIFPLAIQL